MAATAAAGISRSRVFSLARQLACPPSKYFKSIHEVAENLRYNYPDAVRLIGEKTASADTKKFLLRLSDALRSGEPLAAFLQRESNVQGEQYTNDYLRKLESLKKWNDAYVSMTVSAALIVIINMVSSIIYDLGTTTMLLMIMVSVSAAFGLAWVLFRASPQEVKMVSLKLGSRRMRRSRQLFFWLAPAGVVTVIGLAALGVDKGWLMIVAGLFLLPVGIVASRADNEVSQKDEEISAFFRSVGGTATSRGTTLKEALASIKLDSFPTLQGDIRLLDLRLKSFGDPRLCWFTFGTETGSQLADQSVKIFFEAVNLGGDPEAAGICTSDFTMKTAMLRAQRRGVGATFSWLTVVMHAVMAGLMVFLLGVLQQFAERLNAAMTTLGEGTDATAASAALNLGTMFSFGAPRLEFLGNITVGMIILLALINAFAIVASEGTHLIKMTYYSALLFIVSGLCYLMIPPLVSSIL